MNAVFHGFELARFLPRGGGISPSSRAPAVLRHHSSTRRSTLLHPTPILFLFFVGLGWRMALGTGGRGARGARGASLERDQRG